MSDDETLGSMGYVETFSGAPAAEDAGGGKMPRRYFGKYAGTVVQNTDFERHGKLQVQVPDVYGPMISTWAMPCIPFGGLQMGMYVVPPIGAGVWVEFQQGNPDYPIWTGFWWGSALETPSGSQLTAPALPVLLMENLRKTGFLLSDVPVPPFLTKGGIILQSATGAFIRVDEAGVAIFGPTVQINGEMVSLNAPGLVVTPPTGKAVPPP
jgi:hypothetical protein